MAWTAPSGDWEYRVGRMRSLLGCNKPGVSTVHDGSCLWITTWESGGYTTIARGFVMPDTPLYQEEVEKGIHDSYDYITLSNDAMDIIASQWLQRNSNVEGNDM